uniref:pseudouridylate synthase 7 homolog isoform X1 n=3 Tax=Myxine glutinosa TaxID=7769 RepID=UPI00358EDF4B
MARSGIYCVAEMSTLSDEEPPAKCARLSETIKDGSDSTEGREGNEEEKEQSLAGNVQALKTKKGSGEDCPGSWDTKIKAESPFKENDDSEGGHALETGGVSGKVGVSEKVEERVLKENKVKALIQKEKEKEKEEEEIVDEDMEEETTGEGLKEGIQDEILHAEVANEEWQEGGDVGRADEQSGVEKDESGKQQENRFAEAMHHGLMEPDVEITEYVGTEAGFSGILKERYSDFLVYEIDEEGNIVHLTDTVIPLPSTDPEVIENEEIDANDLLNEEERQILSNFLMQQGTEKEVVLKAPEDKAVRAAKHLAVHREFKRLDTRTEQRNGQRVILAFSRRGQKDAPRRGMRWEKGRPKFCRFAVYKENIDTMGAVSLLAKLLRMRHSAFSYAGTKDKRAITVQHMAVCRVTAERLVALNRALPNLRLGNFHYVPRPLRLGNLQGNHFSIVLRNISGSKEQVDNAMCSLRDVGFINYYGMQRFGTTAIPTYMIGRAILRDQWDEAVNLVLKSRPGVEGTHTVRCREVWTRTRNPQAALKELPDQRGVEAQLLLGLTHHVKPGPAAFSSISRNTRLMYVHSYQSLLWNRAASLHFRKFGLHAAPGDLIQRRGTVVVLEKGDEEKASINDVVLPLPGFDVKYPTNCVGDAYQTWLAEDGLEPGKLRHRVRDYALAGAYRNLIVRPTDVTWKLTPYDDPKIPLMPTDMDIMEGRSLQPLPAEGALSALHLEFSLPPASYATMAVREVLKMDTSVRNQSQLNCKPPSCQSYSAIAAPTRLGRSSS